MIWTTTSFAPCLDGAQSANKPLRKRLPSIPQAPPSWYMVLSGYTLFRMSSLNVIAATTTSLPQDRITLTA